MGKVLETVPVDRIGRQGERLQLVIESQKPEAKSFALQSFAACAGLE